MKVVHVGNKFTIYDSAMRAYDTLPVSTYTLEFSKMTGFFLQLHTDLSVNETIYGNRDEKVQKVLNSFAAFKRSLGVILSGDKGIGKSVFARLLCEEAIRRGIPVIIVSRAYIGISSFFDQLDQEVLVLFDEFDKTFSMDDDDDDKMNPQTELLSLFDGISGGKKLYVITCNRVHSLSDYLLNRPGRFHYHFRFSYPSAEDVRTYLEDKLMPWYFGEIDPVIEFSSIVPLNYDCLRAIAFELNTGSTFKEAIADLNIVNTDAQFYVAEVTFSDGKVILDRSRIDFFDEDTDYVLLDDYGDKYFCRINFNTKDISLDTRTGAITVNNFNVNYPHDNHSDVTSLKFRPDTADSLAYTV